VGFYYAEANDSGLINSGTMTLLSPSPTYVEYPNKFETTVHVSRDGNAIVQAPMKDSRSRSWVWAGYRATVPGYESLFSELLQLHYKLRQNETPAKTPWVFLKEDVSNNLGVLEFAAGTWSVNEDYVRVKVIDVTQNVASQGGIVKYGDTRLTFVIDDASWNHF
jgi:hypothetical protein